MDLWVTLSCIQFPHFKSLMHWAKVRLDLSSAKVNVCLWLSHCHISKRARTFCIMISQLRWSDRVQRPGERSKEEQIRWQSVCQQRWDSGKWVRVGCQSRCAASGPMDCKWLSKTIRKLHLQLNWQDDGCSSCHQSCTVWESPDVISIILEQRWWGNRCWPKLLSVCAQ